MWKARKVSTAGNNMQVTGGDIQRNAFDWLNLICVDHTFSKKTQREKYIDTFTNLRCA